MKLRGSIAFGIMDGIITLIGILLAMATLNANQKTILIAAIGAAIADSIANAAGYHVSEEAEKKNHIAALKSSLLCFFATLIAMLIPLLAIVILQPPTSIYISVIIGLTMLFLLGLKIKNWKVGVEYIVLGLFAGILCYIIGIVI